MTEERTHDELIREQFSRQAAQWDTYVTSGGNEAALSWSIGKLELHPDMRVLDVAAGTGLVARAMSPAVAEAVAVDVTPEMVAEGRKLAAAEGLTNVTFEEADARILPYGDGSFALVACRLAMHQVEDPLRCLREMVRVCQTGGYVAVIDITSSEDPGTADTHNRLERLRDPSHGYALPPSQLRKMAEGYGLEIVKSASFEAHRNLESWMDLTETPPEARAVITAELERELDGAPATGMHPFRQDGVLMFSHLWFMLVGRKP